MLGVYLDESNQLDGQVHAVAGYTFTPRRAKRFEKSWKQVLASVDPPLSEFRMTDFENRQREFKDWTEEATAVFDSVAQHTEPDERIAYILDEARPKRGKTRIMADWDYLKRRPDLAAEFRLESSTITWASSKSYPALQAADFLVYELAKEFARKAGRSTRQMRKSGQLLIAGPGGPPRYFLDYDRERLAVLSAQVAADLEGRPT